MIPTYNKEKNVEETQHDSELAMQLKKISDHLVFLEKKIDQLLDARREQRPSFGSKPFGQKSYGQKPYGQKPFGGPNRYGSDRPSGGPPRRHGGHFQKKFTPHHGQRPS